MSAAEGDLGWGWESFPMCASHHLVQAQEKKKKQKHVTQAFSFRSHVFKFPTLVIRDDVRKQNT